MNGLLTYMALLIAGTVFCAMQAAGEEKKQARSWYRLEVQTGETTYQIMGSSLLGEKELATKLEGTEYIMIDDAVYVDSTGTIKSWQEWDPATRPRLYLNPRHVIFFNPLKGDPREAARSPARK